MTQNSTSTICIHSTDGDSQRILALADAYSRASAHAIGRAALALGLAAAERDPSLLQQHLPPRAHLRTASPATAPAPVTTQNTAVPTPVVEQLPAEPTPNVADATSSGTGVADPDADLDAVLAQV